MKHVVKSEGRSSNQDGGRNNATRRDNYIKKVKFLGADPNPRGHVFEAKLNQSQQVVNFTVANCIVKGQV